MGTGQLYCGYANIPARCGFRPAARRLPRAGVNTRKRAVQAVGHTICGMGRATFSGSVKMCAGGANGIVCGAGTGLVNTW